MAAGLRHKLAKPCHYTPDSVSRPRRRPRARRCGRPMTGPQARVGWPPCRCRSKSCIPAGRSCVAAIPPSVGARPWAPSSTQGRIEVQRACPMPSSHFW